MLAPLVINLLIACTGILIAGWAREIVGGWLHAGQNEAGIAAPASKSALQGTGRGRLAGCRSRDRSDRWSFKVEHTDWR
jgi:hypothetical protein